MNTKNGTANAAGQTVDFDIGLTVPLHALRVQAEVTDNIADSNKYHVEIVAQVSPLTALESLIHA